MGKMSRVSFYRFHDLLHLSSIDNISADIFDKKGNYIGNKKIYGNLPKSINKWFIKYRKTEQNL